MENVFVGLIIAVPFCIRIILQKGLFIAFYFILFSVEANEEYNCNIPKLSLLPFDTLNYEISTPLSTSLLKEASALHFPFSFLLFSIYYMQKLYYEWIYVKLYQ